MLEIIGIVLLVQGIGGLVNRLGGSESYSWFVQLHVLPPSMHVAASIVMIVAGGLLVLRTMAAERRDRGVRR